jgi:hypothetical protein
MPDHAREKHGADGLRGNGIRLFATVPDYIVSHALDELWADPECRVVTTRIDVNGRGRAPVYWLTGKVAARFAPTTALGAPEVKQAVERTIG